jgi:hypothetical protein
MQHNICKVITIPINIDNYDDMVSYIPNWLIIRANLLVDTKSLLSLLK